MCKQATKLTPALGWGLCAREALEVGEKVGQTSSVMNLSGRKIPKSGTSILHALDITGPNHPEKFLDALFKWLMLQTDKCGATGIEKG